MLRNALFALAMMTYSAAAADDPIAAFEPKGSATFDHSAFDALLGEYVKPDAEGLNRVDYRGLRADAGKLDAYIAALEAAKPSQLSPDEAHAYWINLYNAKTLDVVLEHYPVESIRDINLGGGFFAIGPWKKDLLTVEGVDLSLDDVEHRIVRAIFRDPMSHYGLNCASYSCPNLMTDAYTGENLDAMLRESGEAYVNHSRGVEIMDHGLRVSRIYKWYAEDFGGEDALKAHWTELMDPAKAARLEGKEVRGHMYDWKLNDVAGVEG